MAVLSGIQEAYYLKVSPRAHKLEDMTTKSHGKLVLAKRPKEYPMTSQQRKIKNVARECGIKPGISRGELVKSMRDCVGPKLAKHGAPITLR